MENNIYCQSCSMPLTKEEDFGSEKDGGKSVDYCQYCYVDGAFTKEGTMEEMIETCIPFEIEAGLHKTSEEARDSMMEYFPKLKRWAQK